jgi:hypothetical protein
MNAIRTQFLAVLSEIHPATVRQTFHQMVREAGAE